MSKLFNVAGVSTVEGAVTARFAHDMSRVGVLARYKHTDIKLVELPHPMPKDEAAKFVLALPEFQSPEVQAALGAKAEPKPVAAPKVERVKKVKEVKEPAVTEAVVEAEATSEAPVVTETVVEADPVKAAKAIVDADPVKRGRRKLIKDTLAKVRERETEEELAAREAAKEAAQLEVDNYMKDVTEDALPKFLREGNIH